MVCRSDESDPRPWHSKSPEIRISFKCRPWKNLESLYINRLHIDKTTPGLKEIKFYKQTEPKVTLLGIATEIARVW